MSWTYIINDLNDEDIFAKYKSEKTIRTTKITKKKGDQLYVK